MSALSDVQALYTSVRSTWTKSQAHVVSHVVLAIVIFVVWRVTLPEISLPKLDAKTIADNDWFKLAKDTGLVYATLLVPIIAVASYGAILRFGGRVVVAMLVTLFPPSPERKRFRLLTSAALEPLALTLKKEEFTVTDLINKSTEFVLKYQSNKSEAWSNYQKSIEALTKNSVVYLGDFSLFALGWIVLFLSQRHSQWVQVNHAHFWPVLLTLSALAWFAWFRVSRAVAVVPSLLLLFVSTMLQIDPDVAPSLEAGEQTRAKVRKRLDDLLEQERKASEQGPSLKKFLCWRLGISSPQQGSKQCERYDNHWIAGYLGYLRGRFLARLGQLARTIAQLIRYVVTGAP